MGKTILILGVLLLVVVSSGCNGGATSSKPLSEMTPSEVVEAYAKAHQIEDFDTMYGFMSEEIKNSKALDAFRRNIKNKEYAMSTQGSSFSFSQVLNEEINGNQATVRFEYELQSMTGSLLLTDTVTLVKEEIGWKLTSIPLKL